MDKVKYLEDDNGNPSSIRLMSFLALFASIVFGLLTILREQASDGIYVTTAFLLAAFAPKTLQKYAEKKVI